LVGTTDVLEGAIDGFMDVAMLHGSLIPYDQVGSTYEVGEERVLWDVAGGGLMDGDGDLEGGMGSATANEEERSNSRGRDAKNNQTLRAEPIAESVVDVGLPSTTWTMKEEDLASVIVDGIQDLVIGGPLLSIQAVLILCRQNGLVLQIIRTLLVDETISDDGMPVMVVFGHSRVISEGLVGLGQKLIYEVKAILVNVIIGGVGQVVMVYELVAEIVADVLAKGCPEGSRVRGYAITKDGDEEMTELPTRLHGLGLLETLMPLLVILQKATGKTRLPEGWSLDTIKGEKILEAGGPLDGSEEEAEVESLSRGRLGKIHPADSKVALPGFHPACPLVHNQLGGSVLVEEVLGEFWIVLAGLEEGGEGGELAGCALHNLPEGVGTICVESDRLLVREVDLETRDTGRAVMHAEVHETPDAFTGANIASVQIELDLVLASAELHGDAIVTLVDVLVYVL
jgi:hypothetical protein